MPSMVRSKASLFLSLPTLASWDKKRLGRLGDMINYQLLTSFANFGSCLIYQAQPPNKLGDYRF